MSVATCREKTFQTVKREHIIRYIDKRGREIALYGEINIPAKEGKNPAVILSHGFNGHYSDFPAECKRFSENGYVCYAFDFCGAQSNGKSVGRTASEYTPFTMVEDLKAVIANIRSLECVDGQIFLFGGSQGGFVSGLTAAEDDVKDNIAAVAMYFPAFNIPDDWRGAPARETALMGYSIGADYIGSVQSLNPFEVISGYRGDVCIIYGDKDTLVKRGYIDNVVRAYGEDQAELTVIPGAGHGFTGEAVNIAAATVLDFLEAHTEKVQK